MKFAEVRYSTGRGVLVIDGVAIVVQGDPCRDPDAPVLGDDLGSPIIGDAIKNQWTSERLHWLADKINKAAENASTENEEVQ